MQNPNVRHTLDYIHHLRKSSIMAITPPLLRQRWQNHLKILTSADLNASCTLLCRKVTARPVTFEDTMRIGRIFPISHIIIRIFVGTVLQ